MEMNVDYLKSKIAFPFISERRLPLFKGFFTLIVFSHGPSNGKTFFTEIETPSEAACRFWNELNRWHITQNHAVFSVPGETWYFIGGLRSFKKTLREKESQRENASAVWPIFEGFHFNPFET